MIIDPLENGFFNKSSTAKLAGINVRQLDYLIKTAELIEDKRRYNLNDIVYISICDGFKNVGLGWQEIYNLYNDVFGGIENFRKFNFLNCDTLKIVLNNELPPQVDYTEKNEIAQKYLDKFTLPESLINEEDITDKIYTIKSIFIKSKYKHCIYMIFVYKIIREIIKQSKDMDLKVDVEEIFLTA